MMDPVQVALSILTLVVSSGLAYYLAKKYGDVAGTEAAIEFEEEKAAEERAARLHSLRNEVALIRKVIEHYTAEGFTTASGAPKFPMALFVTTFVPGSSSLATSKELIEAVNEYLVFADSFNWLVGKYERGGNLEDLRRQDLTGLSEILNRLDRCLSHELET